MLSAWATERCELILQDYLLDLDVLLQPGATISVHNTSDELTLHIGGRQAIQLFDRPDTPFIAVQWRHALRDINITEAFNGKRLLKLLLNLRRTTDDALRDRILALDAEILALDQIIAERESAINNLIYRLYNLTPAEIAIVEAG
jgi:hypothetical protein